MSDITLYFVSKRDDDVHTYHDNTNNFSVLYESYGTRFMIFSNKHGLYMSFIDNSRKLLRLVYILHNHFNLNETKVRNMIDAIIDPIET